MPVRCLYGDCAVTVTLLTVAVVVTVAAGCGATQVYRAPLNWLEELTTGMAHVLMVNSKFTARTFAETFTGLTVVPDVLYPSLNFTAFDVEPDMATIDGLVR